MRHAIPARIVLGLLVFSVMSGICVAQFNSAIQGVITDASGGAVPEARVRVTNVATGVTRETVTLPDGLYRMLNLGPGTYTVAVEKAGFTEARRESVEVAVNFTVRLDISLQVAGISQQVTVTERPSLVETEQARVSGVVDQAQLRDLPINGRNIYNLVALQPGVTGRGVLSSSDSFATEYGLVAYAGGQRWEANSFTIDDSSVNAVARPGNTNVVPNSESVAELRVVSKSFSAVEGTNPGGQIQVLTKSGSNEFHGAVSYYFRNNTLSSRKVFETSIPVFRKNQFGYGIGGPIIKNRAFFFTSYEGLRQSGTRTQSYTIETQEFRDLVLRTRPNTIAAKLFHDYPPPSYPAVDLRDVGSPAPGVNVIGPKDGIYDLGTVWYTPFSDRNGNQINVRIDYEVRPGKDRVYGSFYRNTVRSTTGGVRSIFDIGYDESSPFGNLNWTHTFSPTMLNEFRAAVSGIWGVPVYHASKSAYDLPRPEIPSISITSSTGFGDSFPGGWQQTIFQYRDVFTWIRSAHIVKMGGELRRTRETAVHSGNYIPSYRFASILDFADDEALQTTRLVDPRTGQPVKNYSKMLVWEWAGFVNDDWKVSRKLTMSFGLRYDNYGTIRDSNDQLRNIVFGPGSTLTQRLAAAKVDLVKQFYQISKLNFGPRFGFAWDPAGDGRLAIRGGYGLSFDRVPNLPAEGYRESPPLKASITLGLLYGTTFTYSLGDPSKPFLGYPVDPAFKKGLDERNGILGSRVSLTALDPNLRSPYVHNWFFGVQKQLGLRTMIEANYIGSAGHRLLGATNINRYVGDMLDGLFNGYNPSFSGVSFEDSCCNSIYHGATFQVRRSMQAGLTLQAALTTGKAISEKDAVVSGGDLMDAANRRLDRGLAGYDVTRKLSATAMWEMPFFRTGADWPRRLLGGWQLTGFVIMEGGQPFTVTTSASWPAGDYNGDNVTNDRPNAPASSVKRGGWNRSDFMTGIFKVSDFPIPSPGTNGNLGRNTFRGPGFVQTDMSLSKTFRITEKVNCLLRADAYNAFNRVNVTSPSSTLNSVSFGRSTDSSIPRLFEVGMRISF